MASSLTQQLSAKELRQLLQRLMDEKSCLFPSHLVAWEPEDGSGYIDKATGVRYAQGKLIKGHRRLSRRKPRQGKLV